MQEEDLNTEFVIKPGRGLAVLIINSTFDSELTADPRPGAERDLKNMKELFGKLKYKVEVIENATKDQLDKRMKEITRKENVEDVDCLFCVISTHGREGEVKTTNQLTKQYEHWIYMKDGPVKTETVLHYFDDISCPKLKDKPKLVFIQACRNRNDDKSKAVDRGYEVEIVEDKNRTSHKMTSNSNENVTASRMDVKGLPPRQSLPPQAAASISRPISFRPPTPVETVVPICRNNFLIMSSCISSAVGWSNDEGGYLIYNLHDVFMSKINSKEKFGLIPALTEVTSQVSLLCAVDEKEVDDQTYKCVPMLDYRLTQNIYLIGN